MVEAVEYLQELLPREIEVRAHPFYNKELSDFQILDRHEYMVSKYTNDIILIKFTPADPAQAIASGDPVSCRIRITAYDYLYDRNYTDVTDIFIVADPNHDLVISGYIGADLNKDRAIVEPDDYEHPIKLLKLFYDQTLTTLVLLKFW